MKEQVLVDIKCEVSKKVEHKCDSRHNLWHLQNVTKNALNISKKHVIDLTLMEAICYLHDLTYSVYNPGIKTYLFEGKYITSILTKFLNRFDIVETEKKTIINACGRHPHSFPFRRLNKKSDIYTKILQDADTIDYFDDDRLNNFFDNKPKILFPLKRFLKTIRAKLIKYFLNLSHG